VALPEICRAAPHFSVLTSISWQADSMTEALWSRRRTSFGDAANDYAAGRPRYPQQTLEWTLPAGAKTALDLGAGTGLLTVGLLELGLAVTAVEPLAKMRELIPAAATAMDGTAESIPLPDASVDAVFVGQAWHWFDATKALAETRRVLKPGGRLTLLWNLYDTADPITRDFTDVVDASEERADMAVLGNAQPPFDDLARFSRPEQSLVTHSRRYDVDRVIQLALSRSQAIILGTEGRCQLVDQLRAAMPAGEFDLRWVCEAWRATAV
jgi:SAM-dependent methyltransferase